MMRKKIVSLCMALALCLGLLPVTALAAGEDAPGTLWVGQTQITASGYWKTTTEGNLITGSENDYNVYYDGNGTLTLNGATIQGGTSTGSVPYGAGIYAQCNSEESVSLTIKLISENTITGFYGIYVNASTTRLSWQAVVPPILATLASMCSPARTLPAPRSSPLKSMAAA